MFCAIFSHDIFLPFSFLFYFHSPNSAVNSVRFLPKSQLSKLRNSPDGLPTAQHFPECQYDCSIPKNFLQRTVRVFCRSLDKRVCDHLITCYHQLLVHLQKRHGIRRRQHVPNNEYGSPVQLSQSPFKSNEDSDEDDPRSNKRIKTGRSLMASVKEMVDFRHEDDSD